MEDQFILCMNKIISDPLLYSCLPVIKPAIKGHPSYQGSFSIQSCRSCYATLHLCQRPFYKIFVKFRNIKKNVLKIILIIVNINKDENKSLISNQFYRKNDFPPLLGELFCGGKN